MVDLLPAQSTQIELSYNISSIVSKPLEKLRYSTRIDNNSIVTNYFESASINSSTNLQLEDHSMNYSFNDRRVLDQQEYLVINQMTHSSRYRDNLFTIFTGRNRDGEVIPLFYKQKTEEGKRISSVRIQVLKNTEVEDVINFGYAIIDGALYYNYENQYDSVTGKYRLYYLTISYENGDSENTLINPVEAIPKATYQNLNSLRYTQYKTASGYNYNILTPNNKTVAEMLCNLNAELKVYIKPLESNSIYLKLPKNQPVENEWFVEVVAGESYKLTESELLRYQVPEYKRQVFSKEAPNLKVFNKDCFIVTNKIIKLPYNKISYDGSEFDITVQAYNLNNELVGEPKSIKSVDEKDGFVELETQLFEGNKSDLIIKANFYYKTETYYYSKINFNPYLNKSVLGKKYYFYIKPNEDAESVRVSNTKLNDPSYLYLGAVFYEENYNLEETLSFEVNNRDRFFSLQDSLKKNPYILQSKFGYGSQGQIVQRNNVVVLNLPEDFKTNTFYTEKQLYELFKRKLKIDTNLVINYSIDEARLTLKQVTDTSVVFESTWEGRGDYLVKISESPNFTDEIDYPVYSDDAAPENYVFDISINNLEAGKDYYFKTVYNGVSGKHIYHVKTRSSNA